MMTPPESDRGSRAGRFLDNLETAFLVLLVTLLLLAGISQFILRNVFHTGILWLEPLSRYLVLWIAFAGSIRAVGEERHIRIDVFPRLFGGRGGAMLHALTSLASAAVCLILARWAFDFLVTEREFGGMAFLSVPTWIALAAIPVGFSITGLRLAGRGLRSLYLRYGPTRTANNP